MGKFKKIVQFEKEHLPEYQYNFLYHGVLPGFFFVLGGAVIAAIFVIIGGVTENILLGVIPFSIWIGGIFILLTLFVIYNKKISARLLADKTKELENLYTITDFEFAKQELADENLIVDGKLISEELDPIPLEDCYIIFFCKVWSGVFYFKLDFYNKISHEGLMGVSIDKNLLTYFVNRLELIENRQLFELFIEDKKKFLKLLYRYNDFRKMGENISKVR